MTEPLPFIGGPATDALALVGIRTLDDVRDHGLQGLDKLHGVGPKAIRILATALSTGIIPADDIRVGESRTLKFEGYCYASGISYFFVTNDPGQGPGLHRHPYTETWHVIEGEATIRMGDDTIVAHPGDTAVVQPNEWHGFTNTGTSTLRILCIHASERIIQEWLDGEE